MNIHYGLLLLWLCREYTALDQRNLVAAAGAHLVANLIGGAAGEEYAHPTQRALLQRQVDVGLRDAGRVELRGTVAQRDGQIAALLRHLDLDGAGRFLIA